MKFAMIGAALITLPAIVALIYSLIVGNHVLTYAALFSLGLNSLPFVAAGLMIRGVLKRDKGGGVDLGH